MARWKVYILRCGDGSLYTGATNDLDHRLATHRAGKGARYTRSRLPVALVYSELARGRGRALSREAALKQLTRAQKLVLVNLGPRGYTARVTSPFAKRLPHIVTRNHLATILASTYAAALAVDEEEAHERLAMAVQNAQIQDDLYYALSEGLADRQGARTAPDALLDKLSLAMEKRAGRVRAIEATPAISAVMVRINLAIGIAPESMRAALETDKGRAVLDSGLKTLGRHLVKELLK